jgi:hypothetical protein
VTEEPRSRRVGPYEVLGLVGRGGMGRVFRVQGRRGEDAALKLIGHARRAGNRVLPFRCWIRAALLRRLLGQPERARQDLEEARPRVRTGPEREAFQALEQQLEAR